MTDAQTTLTKEYVEPTPLFNSGGGAFWQPKLSVHPLSSERSYYRSHIIATTIGTNPLAAAASALLSIAARCQQWDAPTDSYHFYQQLIHEVKAFEHAAQAQQYRSETIMVARYILCATLDELILNSPWGADVQWEKYKMLMTFQNESSADERFFVLLDRLGEDASTHIDLLELIYICLSLGYEGKYRQLPQGKVELENLLDRLFECIFLVRGELKKDLHLHSALRPASTTAKWRLPMSLIVCFIATLLLTIYSSFNYLLSADANNYYQELQPIFSTFDAPVT